MSKTWQAVLAISMALNVALISLSVYSTQDEQELKMANPQPGSKNSTNASSTNGFGRIFTAQNMSVNIQLGVKDGLTTLTIKSSESDENELNRSIQEDNLNSKEQ